MIKDMYSLVDLIHLDSIWTLPSSSITATSSVELSASKIAWDWT
ncbi:hypothetical protein MANES_14G155501v8 [Manihot esculenta]|uniref:Uncharacterized protein n=1 Tax=Manihot esculenta TaxID=3983 RepID=A0ACB7GIT7_MANES|nr:hypothetical protein MANES_14G155501v8 [Manihot esculenta]